jgi:amino acid adenylation domain-containing protein/natural product biosynthesis luciferase-like monooxygenase protein
LHNPIRVAEEWSLVDNISSGRVGVSFATGWHPNDFALSPSAYEHRRELLADGVSTIRSLWSGESVPGMSGTGESLSISLFPMPKQEDLPMWLSGDSERTFELAGRLGTGVLTILQDQSVEELGRKIQSYRDSLSKSGFRATSGHVCVMLHTLMGGDLQTIRDLAREPFYRYLKSSFGLVQRAVQGERGGVDINKLSAEELEFLLNRAYLKFATRSLIGTRESCAPLVRSLIHVGVDEIACLVDFCSQADLVRDSFKHLNGLRNEFCGEHKIPAVRIPETRLASRPPAASEAAANAGTFPSTRHANHGIQEPDQSACGSAIIEDTATEQYPISEGQRGIWLMCQIGEGASRAYNESLTLVMKGPMDCDALTRAIQVLYARHESLRTCFTPDGEYQVVGSAAGLSVVFDDLARMPEKDRQQAADELAKTEAEHPFDLGEGPLVRMRIVRLEGELHYLILTLHHIITDTWSADCLLRELKQIYVAECRGEKLELPDPVKFSAYTRRQHEHLASNDMLESEHFWLEQFAHGAPTLNLPIDRERPAVQSFLGAYTSATVDEELCGKLRKVAAAHGCTFFTLVFASFCLLLHKLTGQDELVVGIPSAGQSVDGSDVIGYCINFLPIRSTLVVGQSFSDYLLTIKKCVNESIAHQAYPLTRLFSKLGLVRDPSRAPLVSAAFNLERTSSGMRFGELEVQSEVNFNGGSRFDVECSIAQLEDGMLVKFTYNRDLFESETVERMLRSYRHVLDACTDSGRQVAEFSCLTKTDYALVGELCGGVSEVTRGWDIYELFEVQADICPDKIAVQHAGRKVTYRQLKKRADRLADHLRAHSVGLEDPVGVCLNRGVEWAIAVLALLKVGAVYLPLDPRQPANRVELMVKQSRPSVIITSRDLLPMLPETGASTVLVDDSQKAAPDAGLGTSRPAISAKNLVYIIYTSGSTGVPKGVMCNLQGVMNHLQAKIADLLLTRTDVVAQSSPLSFVISVWQLLSPLLVGAKVEILSDDDAFDATRLLLAASASKVTVLQTTPALLSIALEGNDLALPTTLRLLVCTGEALTASTSQKWLSAYPGVTLVNAYGATETSDDVAHYHIRKAAPSHYEPLGRPLRNMQLHVLDQDMQRVPVGVVGELYVGGVGVGRGYLQCSDVTGERYVPDPFSATSGARLFRTNDLARWLPSSNLEFLGRTDRQIKIRGSRIEPGEVEAALTKHPSISQAFVTSDDGEGIHRRLIAYIAGPTGLDLASVDWRGHLQSWLPEYLIPGKCVVVQHLPLLPNGKVDIAKLPSLESQTVLPLSSTAPRNSAEELLAEAFARVLGLASVGIHDNFFDLGGNSLFITQLIARVRKLFGVQLRWDRVYEDATVAGITTYLKSVEATAGRTDEIATELRKLELMSSREVEQELNRHKEALIQP